MSQTQSTFDDVRKRQSLEQLTDKQKRIVRLLMEGQTQSGIAKVMRVSRSSVSQTILFFERNNLVKKHIGTRYNIIYEVSAQLQRKSGGATTEPVMICRVHSIAMKFSILKQDRPISKDKRSGWTHSWKLRGWEPSAFWFPGKAGEIACTVTAGPRTIVIRMDAKQKIFAKDEMEATHKGYQQLIYVRQQFIEKQRLFGVHLDIEPTGQIVGKAHYGYPMPEDHPAVRQILAGKVPGWSADDSLKELKAKGVIEGETQNQKDATIMGQVLNLPKTLPEMIKASIDPLHADINAMSAHIAASTTAQWKINEQNTMILQLLKIVTGLQEEIREMKSKPPQLNTSPS